MRKSVSSLLRWGHKTDFFAGIELERGIDKTSCLPYGLLILKKEIIQFQATDPDGCVTGGSARLSSATMRSLGCPVRMKKGA